MSRVSLDQAIAILKNDGVVAVPTETVYGLAGRIFSEVALKSIFKTKQRPFFDPLIVHVEGKPQAQSLVQEWSGLAETLTDHFWPGPLTLILPKNQDVSDVITSGLPNVALRCPNHPMALRILRDLGEPFAAPSANLFGRTSPTVAQHVLEEFKNKVPVVDGGASLIGIESTVLLIDGNHLSILRPGAVTKAQLTEVLERTGHPIKWREPAQKKMAPGQMQHHYMPAKPLFAIHGTLPKDLLVRLNQELNNLPDKIDEVVLIKPKKIKTMAEIQLPTDPVQAARVLYSELRKAALTKADALYFQVQAHHLDPSWEAVYERLSKACSAHLKS